MFTSSRKIGKLKERKYWHDNGRIFVHEFYREGKREGERKMWMSNGQIWEHEFYLNGKREGKRSFWHRNGMIMSREYYKNGKRDGEHKLWNDNGQLQDRKYFRDDMRIDASFTRNKRSGFLRMKKHLQEYCNHSIYTFLISDLAKIAYP